MSCSLSSRRPLAFNAQHTAESVLLPFLSTASLIPGDQYHPFSESKPSSGGSCHQITVAHHRTSQDQQFSRPLMGFLIRQETKIKKRRATLHSVPVVPPPLLGPPSFKPHFIGWEDHEKGQPTVLKQTRLKASSRPAQSAKAINHNPQNAPPPAEAVGSRPVLAVQMGPLNRAQDKGFVPPPAPASLLGTQATKQASICFFASRQERNSDILPHAAFQPWYNHPFQRADATLQSRKYHIITDETIGS